MSDLLDLLSDRKISRSEFDRRKADLLIESRQRSSAEGVTVGSGETRRRSVRDVRDYPPGRPGAGGAFDGTESSGARRRSRLRIKVGAAPAKHRYIAMTVVILITLAGARILLSRPDGGGAPAAVTETRLAEDGITDEIRGLGYTADQADVIRQRLNQVGVTAVKVESMSAAPTAEINTVFCQPNGLTGEEDQIFFTTFNGEISYIAYQDIFLYDASGRGFISAYETARDAKG
jgi:hypothetical protein